MISHLVKASFNNLRSSPLRTLLAMTGILVGTAAVVALVSSGEMATEEALKQFKNLGTNLISLSIRDKEKSTSAKKKFKLEDALKIKTASPDIQEVAPYVLPYANIIYEGNQIDGGMIGATEDLARVVNIKMKAGRFVSRLDKFGKYCVIGNAMYEKLKIYSEDPLNTKIKLGDEFFIIIGITEPFPENAYLTQDVNNSLIVPILSSVFFDQNAEIRDVVLRVKQDADIDKIKHAIEQYFSDNDFDKELFFRSGKELIKSMQAQNDIFTILLSLIGSISLLVGGIGVMNIMLVSVLERRREIGIRLALGAKRKEIQNMFLVESVLLSVIGGILGILTGLLCSFIVAVFFHWSFIIFLLPPLIGFTVSVFIGVFFGYYPAHRAAQLDPIQTLRAE